MSKHTEQLLTVEVVRYEEEKTGQISIPELGLMLHCSSWSEKELWDVYLAQAKRLVTCWNGCAGIANPEAIKEVIAYLRELANNPHTMSYFKDEINKVLAKLEVEKT